MPMSREVSEPMRPMLAVHFGLSMIPLFNNEIKGPLPNQEGGGGGDRVVTGLF